ncbi:MAG: transporter [Gemmatimonadota bacterium]|nr:transporter [Gemmatimonadota bacterium]
MNIDHVTRRRELVRLVVALAAALAGGAGGARQASAQEPAPRPARDGAAEPAPLVTDRPDFTESAVAVPAGRLQLETGATWSRAGDDDVYAAGEILLRFGALRGLEARLGLGSFVHEDRAGSASSGLADIELAAKLDVRGVLRADWDVELALLGGSTLPTGSGPAGSDDPLPSARLAAALAFGPKVSAGANLGWTRAEDGQETIDQGLASLALGFEVAPRWGAFLEGFALLPEGDRPDEVFLDGGLTFLLGPEVQLDARFGVELDPADAPGLFAGAGASFRF